METLDPLKDNFSELESSISEPLPVLTVKDIALFPRCIMDVGLNQEDALKLTIGVESTKEPFIVLPRYKTIFGYRYSKIGTIAKFSDAKKQKNILTFSIYGFERVKIIGIMKNYFYPVCKYEFIRDIKNSKEYKKEKKIMRNLLRLFKEWIFLLRVKNGDKVMLSINNITSLGRLSDFIAHYYIGDISLKSKLFNEISAIKRAKLIIKSIYNDIKRVT